MLAWVALTIELPNRIGGSERPVSSGIWHPSANTSPAPATINDGPDANQGGVYPEGIQGVQSVVHELSYRGFRSAGPIRV